MLRNNEVGLARPRRFFFVCILAMQKNHNVSILFDRSTFTKIAHLWFLVPALLRTTVQL